MAMMVTDRSPGSGGSMPEVSYDVRPIAWVASPLTDVDAAPNQGDEDAPDADLVFEAAVADAAKDISSGDELLVLTWLDRARRDVLTVHPRGDERRPLTGVFSTRSPHRPNPIGLHRVRVVSIEGLRVRVRPFEAVDGTPVLDVKPVLEPVGER
jgi:tRNA-Thr(GGU) m(6)t(6)A37 methyltransferase TsaA